MKLSKEQKRELQRLIASGDKLEAIKQFRNMADVGLAEAKSFIENLESGGHRSAAHEETPGNIRQAEQAALVAIKQGNLVEAIRRYQQHSKVGLQQAKDAIDALSIMHRTEGRVNPKLARTLLDMVKAGQKEEAITQLMSQTGWDDVEAKAFLKTIGGVAPGGGACGAGCLKMILGLLVLAGLAWAILREIGAQ